MQGRLGIASKHKDGQRPKLNHKQMYIQGDNQIQGFLSVPSSN